MLIAGTFMKPKSQSQSLLDILEGQEAQLTCFNGFGGRHNDCCQTQSRHTQTHIQENTVCGVVCNKKTMDENWGKVKGTGGVSSSVSFRNR